MAFGAQSNSSWQSFYTHLVPVPQIIQYKCSNPYHPIVRYRWQLSTGAENSAFNNQRVRPRSEPSLQKRTYYHLFHPPPFFCAETELAVWLGRKAKALSSAWGPFHVRRPRKPSIHLQKCARDSYTTDIKILITAAVPASPLQRLKSINQVLTRQGATTQSMLEHYLHALPKMCPGSYRSEIS